jgi:hypothetical protein
MLHEVWRLGWLRAGSLSEVVLSTRGRRPAAKLAQPARLATTEGRPTMSAFHRMPGRSNGAQPCPPFLRRVVPSTPAEVLGRCTTAAECDAAQESGSRGARQGKSCMPNTDLDTAFSAGRQAGLVGLVESDNPCSDELAGRSKFLRMALRLGWARSAHSALSSMGYTVVHLARGCALHGPRRINHGNVAATNSVPVRSCIHHRPARSVAGSPSTSQSTSCRCLATGCTTARSVQWPPGRRGAATLAGVSRPRARNDGHRLIFRRVTCSAVTNRPIRQSNSARSITIRSRPSRRPL